MLSPVLIVSGAVIMVLLGIAGTFLSIEAKRAAVRRNDQLDASDGSSNDAAEALGTQLPEGRLSN